MAGHKEIPAIVVDIGENDSAIMALSNLQREDLGYIEEAEGYEILLKSTALPKKN